MDTASVEASIVAALADSAGAANSYISKQGPCVFEMHGLFLSGSERSLQSGMRLGYFGGSFDPPHLGHLAVARAAADRYALDRVLLVPTGSQPLKPAGTFASYRDRLAMTSLLCEADPRLQASDIEAPTMPPAPNYTIDSLQRLRGEYPAAEFFVIVGADAFHHLPLWRSPAELLEMAEWIVVTRPHAAHAEQSLPPLTVNQRQRVHILAEMNDPTSATTIRRELSCGGDCLGMLSPDLLAYVREHKLYAPED
jgi:nicotinate-nucleotide adenylyltransferase